MYHAVGLIGFEILMFDVWFHTQVRELAEKEPENGVFRMLRSDVTRFLTTILIGTTYCFFPYLDDCLKICLLSLVLVVKF